MWLNWLKNAKLKSKYDFQLRLPQCAKHLNNFSVLFSYSHSASSLSIYWNFMREKSQPELLSRFLIILIQFAALPLFNSKCWSDGTKYHFTIWAIVNMRRELWLKTSEYNYSSTPSTRVLMLSRANKNANFLPHFYDYFAGSYSYFWMLFPPKQPTAHCTGCESKIRIYWIFTLFAILFIILLRFR